MRAKVTIEIISLLLIFLFVYAATNKLMDIDTFRAQLGQSPLLTAFANWVAWFIPSLELIISIMLLTKRFRLVGLYASFSLMIVFTAYIVTILGFSDFVPCSCGGILEKLGWTEHLIFNSLFVILSAIGIVLQSSRRTNPFENVNDSITAPSSLPFMRKGTLLSMLLSAAFSVASVAILFGISDSLVHRQGGMYRVFPSHAVVELNEIDIAYNSYYFAGATNHTLYLGNVTAPLRLLSISTSLKDTSHVKLEIENSSSVPYYNVSVKIDSPHFYFADGAIPYIYQGNIGEWKAKLMLRDSVYFLDYVPTGLPSFAVRSLGANQENTLGKINLEPFRAEFNSALLEKQLDGIFCTDGMLHFDKEEHRLVFVYYYRNQYIVADTSLRLAYRGRTIDSTSHVHIKTPTLSLHERGSKQLASPPYTVNKHSSVSHNLLFIHSNVMAGNEIKSEFHQASVIDVYNLKEGRYLFSFYLSHRDHEKLKSFIVLGDQLFAMYDHYVKSFKLTNHFFSNEKSMN